jgi:hypothetical protein
LDCGADKFWTYLEGGLMSWIAAPTEAVWSNATKLSVPGKPWFRTLALPVVHLAQHTYSIRARDTHSATIKFNARIMLAKSKTILGSPYSLTSPSLTKPHPDSFQFFLSYFQLRSVQVKVIPTRPGRCVHPRPCRRAMHCVSHFSLSFHSMLLSP